MKKIIGLMLTLMTFTQLAYANDLLDWVEAHSPTSTTSQTQPADAAELLTLEPGETEMYPRIAPHDRYLMTVTSKGKDSWIARRFSENGDPANHITDDERAIDAAGWRDSEHVYFLSERAGGLGLWEKFADGEGMQRRIMMLQGVITQPVLLPDKTLIAVSLKSVLQKRNNRPASHPPHQKLEHFNNWNYKGFESQIVRIHADGSEQILSNGINPTLSPDGESIAFTMATGRSMHLYRMHNDGSDLIQITDSRSVDTQPSWSPDGKWLLFTSNRANPDMRHPDKSQWDIWRIDVNGRNLTQLSHDAARDGAPVMGKNGKVYFHSDRKISKPLLSQRQLKSGSTAGFHIWTIEDAQLTQSGKL